MIPVEELVNGGVCVQPRHVKRRAAVKQMLEGPPPPPPNPPSVKLARDLWRDAKLAKLSSSEKPRRQHGKMYGSSVGGWGGGLYLARAVCYPSSDPPPFLREGAEAAEAGPKSAQSSEIIRLFVFRCVSPGSRHLSGRSLLTCGDLCRGHQSPARALGTAGRPFWSWGGEITPAAAAAARTESYLHAGPEAPPPVCTCFLLQHTWSGSSTLNIPIMGGEHIHKSSSFYWSQEENMSKYKN